MVCPFCFHTKTNVYNSRQGDRLNSIWRRRRCGHCGAQFTTYESADPSSILIVKKQGQVLPFSHARLLLELMRVCDHRKDLDESVPYLAATIEQRLYRASADKKYVNPEDIREAILATLKNYDSVAYINYLGRHQNSLTPKQIRDALKHK